MKTQQQLFMGSHRKTADLNHAFIDMVKDGMTKGELKKLIEKRPNTYGRFSNWLERLGD